MADRDRRKDKVTNEAEHRSKSSGLNIGDDVGSRTGEGLAPDEAFQRLASDVRLAILVQLLKAERNEEGTLSFSELQTTVGSDSSAGFAYHLRQLSGHFVRTDAGGYVLTPAGRRAAVAVLSGAFTSSEERRAS